MKRIAPWLVLVAAACGAEVVGEPRPQAPPPEPVRRGEWRPPPAPVEEPPARAARFVGPWLVDQPWHALYEATVYEFRADGTLVHVRSWTMGEWEDYVTGTVSDPERKVTCRFGSGWRSEGEATLVVAGDCDDGRARDIVLAFNEDPSGNVWDAGARVVSVGGETDWDHFGPEWRWAKCRSLDECRFFPGP